MCFVTGKEQQKQHGRNPLDAFSACRPPRSANRHTLKRSIPRFFDDAGRESFGSAPAFVGLSDCDPAVAPPPAAARRPAAAASPTLPSPNQLPPARLPADGRRAGTLGDGGTTFGLTSSTAASTTAASIVTMECGGGLRSGDGKTTDGTAESGAATPEAAVWGRLGAAVGEVVTFSSLMPVHERDTEATARHNSRNSKNRNYRRRQRT